MLPKGITFLTNTQKKEPLIDCSLKVFYNSQVTFWRLRLHTRPDQANTNHTRTQRGKKKGCIEKKHSDNSLLNYILTFRGPLENVSERLVSTAKVCGKGE